MELPRITNTTGAEDDMLRLIMAYLDAQEQDAMLTNLAGILVRLDERITEQKDKLDAVVDAARD